MIDNSGYERLAPVNQEVIILEAKKRYLYQLFRIPGVKSVGIGFKETAGHMTDRLALIVRVVNKLPLSKLDVNDLILPELRFYSEETEQEVTVLTDVKEFLSPAMLSNVNPDQLGKQKCPVPGGFQINRGAKHGSVGTLGGWVMEKHSGKTLLLSNKHVLGSSIGATIKQPGDSGYDLAKVYLASSKLDAAVAEPLKSSYVDPSIEGIGPAVYLVTSPQEGMLVEKCGWKTGHTIGKIVETGISIINDPENDVMEAHNDFLIESTEQGKDFGSGGDSGSLIVACSNYPGPKGKQVVGLLRMNLQDHLSGLIYAHDINEVFSDLDLTVLGGGQHKQLKDLRGIVLSWFILVYNLLKKTLRKINQLLGKPN